MTHGSGRARRLSVAALGAAAVGLLLVLSGCAKDAPQDIFQPRGEAAEKINDLQVPIFIIAGVVGVIVMVMVVLVLVKFRARKGEPERMPRQSHGNPKLEIMWTVMPAVLLAGIAVPTMATIFDLAEQPEDTLTINVIGQQWWWEFDYPLIKDGKTIITANQMVIPVGTRVQLRITSRDVIHSFWIPRLNGKKDAVPGRIHDLWMQADEPGEFWGQCTEFCGLSHANMRQRVIALPQADFDRWVDNQIQEGVAPVTEAEVRGQELFKAQCVRCHAIEGLTDADGEPLYPKDVALVPGVAPNLTHLMSRTIFAGGMFDLKLPGCTAPNDMPTGTPVECLNRPDLEAWLRNSPAMKPMAPDPDPDADGKGRGMPALGLTEAQIDDLVEYLQTLK